MEFSFALMIKAAPARLWDFYVDARKRFIWEEDLEDMRLEGSFTTKTVGHMKLRDMPELTFTLTSVLPRREYWEAFEMPLGVLRFGHELLEAADGTRVRHAVRMDCAGNEPEKLDFLRQVFADVPESLLLLKQAAEQ